MRTPTARSTLSPQARLETLSRLAERHYDVLVIGGGVTGAGTALDAATRGLSVALVEMRDYAAGTSSRSGKLIHGGLRYLEQLNFGLVREALRERSLMLRTLCPHLVRPIRFLYPLHHRLWERVYVGAGLLLYDSLGGARAVPRHRHLSRKATRAFAPGLTQRGVVGAMTFYDTQIDDSRHTLELVRTAAEHGADVASAVRVTGLVRHGGRVAGAHVRDAGTDRTVTIRAKHVINATGVWSTEVDQLATVAPAVRVTAAKGVHVVVPRDRIDSALSMFIRAEDSVLFVRTWGEHWLIGTTDTPWHNALDDPMPTAADVDYLLRNINAVLDKPLTRSDIEGVFAGLRPLVVRQNLARTSAMSREHIIERTAPGLTTVAGGKYTTYRVMARDAVDSAMSDLGRTRACRTDTTPLLGARELAQARTALPATALGVKLTYAQRERLLGRYGALVMELAAVVERRPELAAPISGGAPYLGVEAVYAVTHEGALHLEDVLVRRTHIAIETPDQGRAAAPAVAALIGPELRWDQRRQTTEVARYRAAIAAQTAAMMNAPHDTAAMALWDDRAKLDLRPGPDRREAPA